ncbi:hypothetical protein D1013_03440 [Euzebyella marina]|uniref:Uncharacterized protein n=1 Tax=Euzebyella marina TaxID=1761453 RepID=A0A3G2L2M8_9FLAO|nr:hypothetical protein [Euzebyella marina]AYN66502.1 hypothetical protein D1013_03440 [Euzebyella marina]
MVNGRLKNCISYLLLLLFLSVKMAGLHVLSHSDDNDHALQCAVCDHTTAHNLIPALTPDLVSVTLKNLEGITNDEVKVLYAFISNRNLDSNQLFSRPPPFTL